MAPPLRQAGKEVVDARECPTGRAEPCCCGGHQVLLDRERRKNLAALRHQPEARLRNAVGRQAAKRGPFECHVATAHRHQPHDGADCRGLAHAVAADERGHLAGPHRKAYFEQHLRRPVSGLQALDIQHGKLTVSSPR